MIVPINSPMDKVRNIANILNCGIGNFPFTYLGLPLRLNKPRIGDYMPVLKRIDTRLSGCSTLLSYGEKLTLIRSVFTSLPTFYMCSLSIPAGIMERINKYIRHCFWRKYGMEDRGAALIAWSKVCKPKDRGGLGILDLATHNKCLLMKHAHKFLCRSDLPWVRLIWNTYYPNGIITERSVGSFWWKSISKLIPEYMKLATCT